MKKNPKYYGKVVLFLLLTYNFQILSFNSFAQSPKSFQYQAVVRDVSGAVLVDKPVSFKLSIISGVLPGNVEYVETHSAITNTYGLVVLPVGSGTPVTNLFSDINWSISPHHIKVEADPDGNGFLDMGTTQLLSVPYALYAETSGNSSQNITWLGTSAIEPISPSLNDAYYNSTDGVSYIYDGTSWQIMAKDGAQGIQGIQGIQGTQGLQGGIGLTGQDGTDGSDGKTVLSGTVVPTTEGVNGDFYINTTTNIIYGPKTSGIWGSGVFLVGPQGTAGTNGINGTNGYSVLNGTSNPTTQGVNGDFYINIATNMIFGPKTAGAWGAGTSLVGPQGVQGVQGPAGTGLTNRGNWLSGTIYSNGDYVFDRSTGDPLVNSMWICQTASFTSTIRPYLDGAHWVEFQAPAGPQGIAGINGTDGKTILNGTVDPTTQGVNGDFYINTSINKIFGPKTSGLWGSGVSLVGVQGTSGTNGTNGYSVINGTTNPTTQGVNGDFYINTSTNTFFGPKTSGLWGSGTSLVGPAGTYTSGTGIQISGGVITNTAIDQTVTLTQGGSTTITGTYPNFSISSTDNNTIYTNGTGLSLTGNTFSAQTTTALWNANQLQGRLISTTAPTSGQVLSWNGTSWIPALDANNTYLAGTGLTLSGSTFNSVWTKNGNHIYNNNIGRVGIGTTSPNGKLEVKQDVGALDTEPLFEVKNKLGQTVFVVYPDSVHVFVKDMPSKSNQGGFAVSGRSNSKAITNHYLNVNPLNTKIWTQDSIQGFDVKNIAGTTKLSYLRLSPENYYIGHESGLLTTGIYNCFFGYQSGFSNTTGDGNVFIGYKSGYLNQVADYNTFIGFQSGYSCKGSGGMSGDQNSYLGYQSGYSNSTGYGNTLIGYQSGYSNATTSSNVFVGNFAGKVHVSGDGNTYVGATAGDAHTTGNSNCFIGSGSATNMTSGIGNVIVGGYASSQIGIGDNNISIGYNSAQYHRGGSYNINIGYCAGKGDPSSMTNSTYSKNIFIGHYSGYKIKSGIQNTALGDSAGYVNETGSGNVFIGFKAGAQETGSNKLYIDNSNTTMPLIWGDFSASRVGVNRVATANALEVGGDASKTTASAWLANSDKRIKTEITDIENSFETILKLRPVKFKYTDEWKKRHPSIENKFYYNFIAQEYQNVFPESVKGSGEYLSSDNKEILQIDTYNAQIVTIKAVQDLIKLNIKQNNEIESLKAEIEKVKRYQTNNK